jgi:NhaA family Na+:H+ antiporter
VLTLLGKRVPPGLRALLLAIAIIDDIVAILVIAFFYSSGVDITGLLIGAAGIAGVLLFQVLGVRSAWAYVLPGAVLWAGLLQAHVHPTLTGVILGLLTPVVALRGREYGINAATKALDEIRERLNLGRRDEHELVPPVQNLQRAQLDLLPPVTRVESALHPWVAFGIMPLFAFANAGVSVQGVSLTGENLALALGVIAGLVAGKPLGIVLTTLITVRLRLFTLPPGVTWPGILLLGCLAGIGFTMAIFIAALAFPEAHHLAAAKLAVLSASVIAAVLGLLAGRAMLRPVNER